MKKQTFTIFLIVLIISIIVIGIIVFKFSPVGATHIENEIKSSNYCGVKEDCVSIGGKCPFGCDIYVNKNEAERIKRLVESYHSGCAFECVKTVGVECINNKCVPQTEE